MNATTEKCPDNTLILEIAGTRVKVSFAPQSNPDVAEKVVQILANSYLETLWSLAESK